MCINCYSTRNRADHLPSMFDRLEDLSPRFISENLSNAYDAADILEHQVHPDLRDLLVDERDQIEVALLREQEILDYLDDLNSGQVSKVARLYDRLDSIARLLED